MSYFINRFYRKISTAKPSTLILSIAVIAAAIFLFGGGLYSTIMKVPPAVYHGGRFYILYPELGAQFIFDSVVAGILYTLGIVGLMAIYQSTKYAYKPRQAYMTFLVGISLLIIAYIFIEMSIQMKIRGG
jgi:hypothetical protein